MQWPTLALVRPLVQTCLFVKYLFNLSKRLEKGNCASGAPHIIMLQHKLVLRLGFVCVAFHTPEPQKGALHVQNLQD